MDFFNKISIVCFSASYLVALAIEWMRIFVKSESTPARFLRGGQLVFAMAGLFAHSVYLVFHGGVQFGSDDGILVSLNNWYGWCLLGSWILAVAYLGISLRQAQTNVGLFLLPAVLGMSGVGYAYGSFTVFSEQHVRSGWNWVHGFSLLFGTVVVALGCIFGIIYLIQAIRLKRKIPGGSRWLQLPSLEWLQLWSERCLISSAVLLGIGLASGIAISRFPRVNLAETADGMSAKATPDSSSSLGGINWSDPVIWSSGILFAWLVAVVGFSLFYRPARQGRKVAYLVVASFCFLVIELLIAWGVGHATEPANPPVSGNVETAFREIGGLIEYREVRL